MNNAAANPTTTLRQTASRSPRNAANHASTQRQSSGTRPRAVVGTRAKDLIQARSLSATARGTRQSAPVVTSSEPTTSATSYAEAAGLGASAPGADDHGPFIVICAIGAAALIVAVTAARIAIGR